MSLGNADRPSPPDPVGSLAGRNAALLLLQRGAHIAAGLLFAVVVPRMMGPDIYGRYALITALALMLALLSSLGVTNTIGRYIPEFIHRGEMAELRRFVGSLLTLRLASGAAAAVVYLAATVFWLRDVDPAVLVIMAANVFVQALTTYVFALFLGFDQAARWGMAEALRRWLSVILVIPAFTIGGLRGASLALLTTEVVLLCIGLRWSRLRVSPSELRLDTTLLLPYLRFGLFFFANHALFIAFQASGEPLVRIMSGGYAEVSYFALANNVYLAAAGAFPQLTLAFVPMLTRMVNEGATRDIAAWVERLLTWLTVASVTALLTVLLLADSAVRLILGDAYAPVAANLPLLMFALLMLAVSSVTVLLALVHERPGVALAASGLRLVVFWAAGPLCVAWWGGSFGACVAVLAASTVHAAFSAWRMRDVLGASVRSAAVAAGLGALFLPLVWLSTSAMVNVALCGLVVAGYAVVLLRARVVTPREVGVMLRAISTRMPAAEAPDKGRLWRPTM